MAAYNRLPKIVYNEFDEKAAAWLRELIRRGLIAPGDVDTRSIVDVRPDDLRGYTQCHFFAGIGVWSYAARRAGWPDDRPLWTGSPPCQPFSSAGKGLGTADERHLWPAFFHLIDVCRPDTFFGEQVASKDALAWLDHVSADVEGAGYAFGAFDLCAAGFGAPHIRQRLKFVGTRTVADATVLRQPRGLRERGSTGRPEGALGGHGAAGELVTVGVTQGDAERSGLERHTRHGDGAQRRALSTGPVAEASELGDLALPDDAFWRANLSRGDLDDGSDAGRSEGAGDARTGGSGDGLADDSSGGRGEERPHSRGFASGDRTQGFPAGFVDGGSGERLADRDSDGCSEAGERLASTGSDGSFGDGAISRTADPHGGDASAERQQCGGQQRQFAQDGGSLHAGRPGPTNGHRGDVDWLLCRDGKWRPVEPGTFPLAHGAAARVGRLRGYGNAIVAQVAEGFIASYLEAEAADFDLGGHDLASGCLIDGEIEDLLA